MTSEKPQPSATRPALCAFVILLTTFLIAGGIIGMYLSFGFLCRPEPANLLAGCAGFVAGAIFIAAGVIGLSLLATRSLAAGVIGQAAFRLSGLLLVFGAAGLAFSWPGLRSAATLEFVPGLAGFLAGALFLAAGALGVILAFTKKNP